MKNITTRHTEIGYANNVDIVEKALREQFGFSDASHILRAVAAHIWSGICAQSSDDRKWGTPEVVLAVTQCQQRLLKMLEEIKCVRPGCAIGYPHFEH